MTNKNLIATNGKSGSGKDLVAQIIQYLTHTEKDYRKVPQGITIDTFEDWKNIYNEYDRLTSGSPYQIHRFADNLKEIVSLLTGIPREDLEKEEVKSSFLPPEYNTEMVQSHFYGDYGEWDKFKENPNIKPIYNTSILSNGKSRFDYWEKVHQMTVREFLQKIGTDAMRDRVHTNIWVNSLFAQYKEIPTTTQMILNRGLRKGDLGYISGQLPKWIIPDLRFPNEFKAIKNRNGIVIRVERDYDRYNPKFSHSSETALDNEKGFDYVIDNNGTIEQLVQEIKLILEDENII